MYVSMIFQAVFIGYSVGTASIIGYHFGAKNDKELKGLLRKSLVLIGAFSIFSFSFLFSGFAILGSSFFTALNNGLVSAAISFMRTLVFQVAAVLIFPLFLNVDGIWISIVAAEMMAVIVTALFLRTNQKNYLY